MGIAASFALNFRWAKGVFSSRDAVRMCRRYAATGLVGRVFPGVALRCTPGYAQVAATRLHLTLCDRTSRRGYVAAERRTMNSRGWSAAQPPDTMRGNISSQTIQPRQLRHLEFRERYPAWRKVSPLTRLGDAVQSLPGVSLRCTPGYA